MATVENETGAPAAAPEIALESSTYEIIRNRLSGEGKELRRRLETLNEGRKEVFGSIETTLLGTERVTTGHNCVPRDMVAIGSRFLFGYNVHFGLKTERGIADVFSVFEFREKTFHELPLDLLSDEQFAKDFHDIYRYYKDAVFAKFFRRGPHLFMVFRVGKGVGDIKAFKWLVRDDSLVYIDNRSDHEVAFPSQHEFEWKRTHRDLHQHGDHPHISIEDRLFVETVGGDLTIKIEDNTESGEGIYSEPVDNPDQTLDDAEIYYAIVGNIVLLKIRPYQEQAFRYIVYNEKIQRATRLDSIEHACVLLPDDHGLIFSNGYYLQDGQSKTFGSGLKGMLFERRIAAPNGEDYLYVFYHRRSGSYVLLPYNLISQQVDTPIVCHGYSFFEGGEMICFKGQDEPQKHHAIQLWQTPYVGKDYKPPTQTDSYLYKIGNKDIVRGMAECYGVLNLIEKEDTYAGLYIDLVKEAGDIVDSYFWIGNEEAGNLKESLLEIKQAATAAVDEFEKVVRVRQNTATETARVSKHARETLATVNRGRFDSIDGFVKSLAELRTCRGEIISLRDLRYVELDLVESLEGEVAEESDRLAGRCVEFLLKPDALEPYQQKVEEEQAKIGDLTKVTEARKIEDEIATSASELEMLIEIVSNLKIDDATQRTAIIDNISTIFSTVNQARASLKKKTRELLSVEGITEFNSQMKLLNQGVVNYLDICDTPEKCDEFLTKMMVQIEELEGRFAEFDEFVIQLTEKREEIYNAFETKKLSLVEARNKRATALAAAADRILKGIKNRVENFETVNEINGYFAADLMIEKVRDIVEKLGDLDDSVKVDDIQSRLKTVREDAVRQLKDRQDLYVDGENIIKFGSRKFTVNVQPLDLTTVFRDDELCLHLTGTNFFEPIVSDRLAATKDVWNQDVVSENRNVYRAEFLAHTMYLAIRKQVSSDDESGVPTLEEAGQLDAEQLQAAVARFMGPRYSEGYVKGVHDHDAALILHALLDMGSGIGLLRFHTRSRALANVFWNRFANGTEKKQMAAKLKGFGAVIELFPDAEAQSEYQSRLQDMLGEFVAHSELFPESLIDEAAEYLFCELVRGDGFVVSRTAAKLYREFNEHLTRSKFGDRFTQTLKSVQRDPAGCLLLLRDWVEAFLEMRANGAAAADSQTLEFDYVDEVAVQLVEKKVDPQKIVEADVFCDLEGMVGSHPRVEGAKYRLHYNEFMLRVDQFKKTVVPRFIEYGNLKKELLEEAREEMRLEEFRPHVLTSFVRNKLLDTVYLPMIGDNLAKQMGEAGEQKRTDRMGLLLLVSPPGYGKTTLMEYIANRLGIIFMKINGPALGHEVTSLDPEATPNAGAREEIEKLNLSLEMGDNVMIYLDDIQHTNPEFLQKFISLCDATRKIEGVYKGRTRTYDLRGRKVAVVMAGNPYTESGEKFQIPDMLANRADVYNLGEVVGDNGPAFEMSYLENCMTSSPVLNHLATRSQKDVYAVMKMAELGNKDGVELDGNYSLEELNEMVATMQKLMRVRDVILQVNRAYIESAAQSDDYRTEPPFKLQGSYRNMNRIAEKVYPIMNDEELETLIVSNYEQDSQTLTSGTEANMLKFKEIMGILSDEEAKRWENIQRTFQRNVRMRGMGEDDKIGQAIVELSAFGDGLNSIRQAMTEGVSQLAAKDADDGEVAARVDELIGHVGGLREGIASVSEALSGGLQQVGELVQQSVEQAATLVPAPTPAPAPVAFDPSVFKELAEAIRSQAAPPQAVRQRIESPPDDDGEPTVISESVVGGGPGSAQKITVINKIPRTMLNVMEQQFKLMNGWMEPLTQMTHSQSADVQELKQLVESCLHDYEKLMRGLGKARGRSDS
jgi:hypothetical protein